MITNHYNLGDKVYAVIGLKIITAIVTGVVYKAAINNISDKIEDSNTNMDYFVSAINENGVVDTYPYAVSSADLFTDITEVASALYNKTKDIVK